jgi:hypothetical protein
LLFDLSLGVIEFLLCALDVGEQVGLRLIGALEEALVQFGLCFTVFDLFTHLTKLALERLILFLLLLKTVGQEQTLVNTAFSSGRCLSDRLDQSVANFKPFTSRSLIPSHMHDGLVEFLLDHLVVGQSFTAHSQLSPDVARALATL